MPSASAAIAASKALTISPMSEVSEPVHCDVGTEQRRGVLDAVLVGTKNGFVVTWLTNTKFHSGVSGKFPAAGARPRAETLPCP